MLSLVHPLSTFHIGLFRVGNLRNGHYIYTADLLAMEATATGHGPSTFWPASTFDGNKAVKEKVTLERIRKHLEGSGVYPKNPAQHSADMSILEHEAPLMPAFLIPNNHQVY